MALVFLVGATVGFAQTKPDASVARSQAKHLRRGFNLNECFAQVYDAKGYTKEHFQSWNALGDIALIKAAEAFLAPLAIVGGEGLIP